MLEDERMRNLQLQACQRETEYNYEKQITSLRFKVSQLLRYIGTDLLPVQEDMYGVGDQNYG